MSAARKLYERWVVMTPAEQVKLLEGMKGGELAALLHYAEGREPTPTRDSVMGLVLVVAGERYLSKAEAKAEKKAKRIL